MDWTIPGLYVLVYLDKRAEGFDLIHRIDMERPYVVCPQLKGKEWEYLRRKIGNINTVGILQLINHVLDFYPGPISTSITKPPTKGRPDVSALVELMSAQSFIPHDRSEVREASIIAIDQLEKIGYNASHFFAEIIRVDFGTAGLHQYCLFGGYNRFVHNILKKRKSVRESLGKLISTMDEQWHAKIASYLSVILWSKVKVSPLLRATLIDDSLAFRSQKRKREVEAGFQNMVMQAMMAYARNPL